MNFFASKKARASKAMSVLGATLGVLLLSVSLFAQANFGRILGTVTDQSGGVLAGATVTVIDTERGVTRTLITDDAGEYNAPTLIPSTYTVRVEAKGFQKLERQNVVLGVGKEVRVDLTPLPGEQQQTGEKRPHHQPYRNIKRTVHRLKVQPRQRPDIEHLGQLPQQSNHNRRGQNGSCGNFSVRQHPVDQEEEKDACETGA